MFCSLSSFSFLLSELLQSSVCRFPVIVVTLICREYVRCHLLDSVYRFVLLIRLYSLIWKPPWLPFYTGSFSFFNCHDNYPITPPKFPTGNLRPLNSLIPIHFSSNQDIPQQKKSLQRLMHLPSHQTTLQICSSSMAQFNPNVTHVPIDLCYEATRASQTSLLIRPANRISGLCQGSFLGFGASKMMSLEGWLITVVFSSYFHQMKRFSWLFVEVLGVSTSGWWQWSHGILISLISLLTLLTFGCK